MEEKKGLIDRILKSARDDDRGPAGKVQRKKITLQDLKRVIEDYVQKTAGMGDPELRGRLVQMELTLGTLREQNASLQKALESARSGWKAAQDEIASISKESSGMSGDLAHDLSKAKAEALEAHTEIARLKGKLAAAEMRVSESGGDLEDLKKKAENFAARLDEARRNEKKQKREVTALTARLNGLENDHRRRVEELEDRIDELASGYDYVGLLRPVAWDDLLERVKADGARANELSVEADPSARSILETVVKRCDRLRLDLEAAQEEEGSRMKAMEEGKADYPSVFRIEEIHNRAREAGAELDSLERIIAVFIT